MNWNAEQYLKFAEERTQPCRDLISRLHGTYETILDLGCGPGNSTAQLKKRFSDAAIIGLDAEESMLEKARRDYPELTFQKGTAPEALLKQNKSFDLVFSNACIHWIPEQERLLSILRSVLSEHGTLAIQIPLTEESAFYQILHQLIQEKWTMLQQVKNFHQLRPEEYYNILSKSFRSVTIWKTNYYHLVADERMVVAWYRGSGLRSYLQLLSEQEQDAFLFDLQERIRKQYPVLEDGKRFLVMPRLFMIAEA